MNFLKFMVFVALLCAYFKYIIDRAKEKQAAENVWEAINNEIYYSEFNEVA